VTLLALLPLGWHAGVVDAAFSQQVYTASAPTALWLRADGRVETLAELRELRTFLPPVPRVFAAWLRRAGGPGDRLLLFERRWLLGWSGPRQRLLRFEEEETMP
jgi:hypothetical protein